MENNKPVTEAELMKRSVAPRVTYEFLTSKIATEDYVRHGLLIICIITMVNGFKVIGQSSCADPANFMEDVGKRLARKDAENKMWSLLGYQLKDQIFALSNSKAATVPDARTYIGTKVVHASPMTRFAYNELRGWQLPANENGADEGYIVEYADQFNKANVEGYEGYISWSPRDVFEGSYALI